VRIYLDYNATTPLLPEVIETITRLLPTDFGNASSVHAYGQRARALVDQARAAVAALVDADPADIVFTGGGTEADNLALRGAAEAIWPTGRREIITTPIEHEAVLQTAKALARGGWTITSLPMDASGVVDPATLSSAISERTALVSVMHANNEVGTIQPIADLAAIARAHGAWFHTDAVQSAGKIPVSVKALNVDLLAIAGHKFGGPKGVGALWIRRGRRLIATMTGGRQERNRRAGTENVPALAGFGTAATLARTTLETHARSVGTCRDQLEREILRTVADTAVNGDRARRVPNTTNISFDGIEAESLLIALDLEGVAVSTGSACSSGTLEASHVLRAMGLSNARARNSIRFSLGPTTTMAEIDFVAGVLPRLVARLRQLGRPAMAAR